MSAHSDQAMTNHHKESGLQPTLARFCTPGGAGTSSAVNWRPGLIAT